MENPGGQPRPPGGLADNPAMTLNRFVQPERALALARETLHTEAQAVAAAAERLGGAFVQAVQLVLSGSGRVVVMGMGKSGHVGRKMAATLASTGTPAMFVHPAEASHGDLGMITAGADGTAGRHRPAGGSGSAGGACREKHATSHCLGDLGNLSA